MRILAIDGLRATAMTMVVAQHCGLLPFGWTGVWLFFVISGYVITQGFVSGAYLAPTVGGAYIGFMARRALRIVPVYVLYLLCCVPAILLVGESEKLVDLGYLATFTYNWQMMFEWSANAGGFAAFGHLWTVSIEQQFYLVFGLFALLLPVRWQVVLSAVIIAAGPLIRWRWSLMLDETLLDDPGRHAFAVYAATHCHVDAFLMGSVIARLEPEIRARPREGTWASLVAFAAAMAYSGSYVAINHALLGARGTTSLRNVFSGVLYGQYREVFVYLAVDLVAAATLVHVLLARPGTRFFALPAVAWVGRVSYGGYLFHALVLWLAGHVAFDLPFKESSLLERVGVFVLAWSVTVALASASFVWFEAPFAKYWRTKTAVRPGPVRDSVVAPEEGESRQVLQDTAPGT